MKKAYLYIDGFSFKRISDFYKFEHKRKSRINLAAIETYLRYEIERRLGWKNSFEHLAVEKHFYYSGREPETVLNFEKNLINAGYAVHYSASNLFAPLLIASELKKFDVFILVSTQGQYAGILRQVRQCEKISMLIGWDSFCTNSAGLKSKWKTDKALIENANIYCPLERILDLPNNKHPLVEIMFEKFYSSCPLNLRCG